MLIPFLQHRPIAHSLSRDLAISYVTSQPDLRKPERSLWAGSQLRDSQSDIMIRNMDAEPPCLGSNTDFAT